MYKVVVEKCIKLCYYICILFIKEFFMSTIEQKSILILEDNTNDITDFEKAINEYPRYKIIAKTNSSFEALKITKNKKPNIIIADLELHNGIGSGLSFLQELKSINLLPKPIIIVTTNIISDVVYNQIHKNYADMIFCKKQIDYSPSLIFNTLDILIADTATLTIQSTQNREEFIEKTINSELDKIGISYKLKGREYLFDAIFYLLTKNEPSMSDFSIFQYLAKQHTASVGSISRTIQTAINAAWRNSSIDDLSKLYTAKVNYNTGVPTPTEFIYYYVEKIAKLI